MRGDSSQPTTPDSHAPKWFGTFGLASLAIGLRLVVLWAWPPIGLMGDESVYVTLGERWASSGEFDELGRAPGYIWFVGALFWLKFHGPTTVQIAQVLLAGISIPLIVSLAQRELGRRPALIAGAFFALDPTMIAYTHYFFSETLGIVLMLAGAASALRGMRRESVGWCALGGGGLGAAMLVRSMNVVFLLAAVGAVMLTAQSDSRGAWTRRFRLAAPIIAAWAAVVLPYSWLLTERHGAFVLVDVSFARTLWHANRLDYTPGYDWRITDSRMREAAARHAILAPPQIPETPAAARNMWRQEIAFVEANPGTILARVPEKFAALWNPTSFLHRRIARGQMSGLERASGLALVIATAATLFYIGTLVVGVLGLCYARAGPLRTFVLIALMASIAIHLVMVSLSRYRLPLMPLVFVYAAAALVGVRQHFSGRSLRTWIGVAIIASLGALWTPYWRFAFLKVDESSRRRVTAAENPIQTPGAVATAVRVAMRGAEDMPTRKSVGRAPGPEPLRTTSVSSAGGRHRCGGERSLGASPGGWHRWSGERACLPLLCVVRSGGLPASSAGAPA